MHILGNFQFYDLLQGSGIVFSSDCNYLPTFFQCRVASFSESENYAQTDIAFTFLQRKAASLSESQNACPDEYRIQINARNE